MKKNKQKETDALHTSRENIMYMVKNWWDWDKRSFWLAIIRIPILVVTPMLLALIPKLVIDCVQNGSTVGQMTALVVIVAMSVAGLQWVAPYLNQQMAVGANSNRMRYNIELFRKSMDTDYENIEGTQGRLKQEKSKEFVDGFWASGQRIHEVLVMFAMSLTGIFTYAAVLSTLNPLLILLILVICVGDYALAAAVRTVRKKLHKETAPFDMKWDYLMRRESDFATGKDIRLFRMAPWLQSTMRALYGELLSCLRIFYRKNRLYNSARGGLVFLRNGAAYAYLIYAVLRDQITIANFTFYFALVTGFSRWLSDLTWTVFNIRQVGDDCDRFRSFLEIEDRMKRDAGAALPGPEALPCEIEFRDVLFTYQGAEESTIRSMNFHIKKGEKIAIVGVNGAGKTTCIKLLCGLYQPTQGDIRINGVPARDFNRDDYYGLFSAVFQDVHFLPMSIAQNVALCETDQIDMQRVENVLRAAGLWDRIQKLEDGVETKMVKEIHENAVNFSGGELQKLLLARALYKDAPILVLDEPTAALDPIAENQLYLQYRDLTEGKTSFFISHRLSSTRFCDRILFVNDGRIVEEGTHDELMAMKSEYYDMFEVQSHYYQDHPEGGEENV